MHRSTRGSTSSSRRGKSSRGGHQLKDQSGKFVSATPQPDTAEDNPSEDQRRSSLAVPVVSPIPELPKPYGSPKPSPFKTPRRVQSTPQASHEEPNPIPKIQSSQRRRTASLPAELELLRNQAFLAEKLAGTNNSSFNQRQPSSTRSESTADSPAPVDKPAHSLVILLKRVQKQPEENQVLLLQNRFEQLRPTFKTPAIDMSGNNPGYSKDQ